MSMKYLGKTFDIHTGGVDLIFPHHENEIAQSESATGKKFVNYFLEGEHLLVNGQKMSKSTGNVFTLRDFESKKINPLAFRYFVLGAHYRSKLNFTWEALEASGRALEKLYEFVGQLKQKYAPENRLTLPLASLGARAHTYDFHSHISAFKKAISDDLNTPKALAVVWSLVHEYNKLFPSPYQGGARGGREVLKLLYEFDEVLGLGFKKINSLYPERSQMTIPRDILELAEEREKFRKNENWKESDKLREEIKKLGFSIEDSENGPSLKANSKTRKKLFSALDSEF